MALLNNSVLSANSFVSRTGGGVRKDQNIVLELRPGQSLWLGNLCLWPSMTLSNVPISSESFWAVPS